MRFASAIVAAFVAGHTLVGHAQSPVSPRGAKDHLGEQATVCGRVATARFASGTRGQPTFLNIDVPYPNQVFTVVIWRDARVKFGAPEVTYRDKNICVSGKITSYRGEPQIVATEPKQIVIKP